MLGGSGSFYVGGRVPECNEARRKQVKYDSFDVNSFMEEVRKYMHEKKTEYDTVKQTPVVGAVRAMMTRYEEKNVFSLIKFFRH